MARAYLNLDKEQVCALAVRLYLGTPFDADTLYGRRAKPSPVWPGVLSIIFDAEQKLYASSGATGNSQDEGIPWSPNAEDYGAWKILNFGTPPGILTGALMRQLTGQSGDHLYRSGDRWMVFGSNAPVGRWSGKVSWPVGKGRDHVWSLDPDSEDVGGLQAQGGFHYLNLSNEESPSIEPRPPISLNEQDFEDIEEVVVEYVTQAPMVRGWFQRGRGRFSGLLRRKTGAQPAFSITARPGTTAPGARRVSGFGAIRLGP